MIELRRRIPSGRPSTTKPANYPITPKSKSPQNLCGRLMRDFTRMEAASNGAAGRIDHAIDVLSGR